MTIPIIPGPFSFLEGAGEALGAIGQEREKRRQQDIKEARDRLVAVLDLVAKGRYDPEILRSTDVQRDLGRLGLPEMSGKPTAEDIIAQRRKKAVGGLSDTGFNISQGLPTRGTERKAEITGEALEGVSGETPQGRAVAGVPSARGAADAEAGAELKAQYEAEVQRGLTAMLTATTPDGKPAHPETTKLIQEAAAGLLPYRIAQLQADRTNLTIDRQIMSDNARFLLGALNAIPQIYKSQEEEWWQALNNQALSNGVEMTDPEQANAFMAEYARQRPKPTFDRVRDAYLQSTFGMTAQEYHERLQSVMDQVFSRDRVNLNTSRKPGTPAAQGPQGSKLQQAVAALRGQDLGSVLSLVEDAYNKKAFTSLEIRAIFKALGKEFSEAPEVQEFLKKIGEGPKADPKLEPRKK